MIHKNEALYSSIILRIITSTYFPPTTMIDIVQRESLSLSLHVDALEIYAYSMGMATITRKTTRRDDILGCLL